MVVVAAVRSILAARVGKLSAAKRAARRDYFFMRCEVTPMITCKTQSTPFPNLFSQFNCRSCANYVIAIGAFLFGLSLPVEAATIVTLPDVTLTFDGPQAPDVGDFSTANLGGGGADILDSAGMDARVATLTASEINTPLVPSTTVGGSGTNALARYNSAEMHLSTRPTTVAFTPLMATLQNGAGGTVTSLALEYDLGAYAAMPPDGDLEGHPLLLESGWRDMDAR
jgi:hypothetical protein